MKPDFSKYTNDELIDALNHIDVNKYPSNLIELKKELKSRKIEVEQESKYTHQTGSNKKISEERDEIKEILKSENQREFDKKLKGFFIVIFLIIVLSITFGDKILFIRDSITKKYINIITEFGLDPLYVTNILMIVLTVSYRNEYNNWKNLPDWVKLLAGSTIGMTILISIVNIFRIFGIIDY